MDTVDAKTRSMIMSKVKGKHTKPELIIRKALHRKGFRYRLHYKKLPGHPDLVFPKYHAIILINGCFWHDHGCHLSTKPSTRKEFWREKFRRNKERDQARMNDYKKLGWHVLVIWECALKGKNQLDIMKVLSATVRWLKTARNDNEISGFKKLDSL